MICILCALSRISQAVIISSLLISSTIILTSCQSPEVSLPTYEPLWIQRVQSVTGYESIVADPLGNVTVFERVSGDTNALTSYSPDGRLLWKQSHASYWIFASARNPDITHIYMGPTKLSRDAAGNLYLTARVTESIRVVINGVNHSVSERGWLRAKYDSVGNLLWMRKEEKLLADEVTDSQGNWYVVGTTDESILDFNPLQPPASPLPLRVARYSTSGVLEWERIEESVPEFGNTKILVDRLGNIIVGTASQVRAYTPAGQVLWEHKNPSGKQYALVEDNEGGYIRGLYGVFSLPSHVWQRFDAQGVLVAELKVHSDASKDSNITPGTNGSFYMLSQKFDWYLIAMDANARVLGRVSLGLRGTAWSGIIGGTDVILRTIQSDGNGGIFIIASEIHYTCDLICFDYYLSIDKSQHIYFIKENPMNGPRLEIVGRDTYPGINRMPGTADSYFDGLNMNIGLTIASEGFFAIGEGVTSLKREGVIAKYPIQQSKWPE